MRKINPKYLFIAIALIILIAGITFLTRCQLRSIKTFSEKGPSFADFDVAFISEGDIWGLQNQSGQVEKILDAESIIDYSFSPDKKRIYWSDGQTIWSNRRGSEPESIVQADKIDTSTNEPFLDGFEGGLRQFKLSPDGKYIAYEQVDYYTSCCGVAIPPDIPVYKIYIINSDGSEKRLVEYPTTKYHHMMILNQWLPDSEGVLFYLRDIDEVVTGSPFFRVGINGKYPQIYTPLYSYTDKALTLDSSTITMSAEPSFSPRGNRMAYRNDEGIWLSKTDGTELKRLSTGNFSDGIRNIFRWSDDGNFLLVDLIFYSPQLDYVLFKSKGERIFSGAAENPESFVFSADSRELIAFETEGAQIFIHRKNIGDRKSDFIKIPISPKDFGANYSCLYPFVRENLFAENGDLYFVVNFESDKCNSFTGEDEIIRKGAEEAAAVLRRRYPELWKINLTDFHFQQIEYKAHSIHPV